MTKEELEKEAKEWVKGNSVTFEDEEYGMEYTREPSAEEAYMAGAKAHQTQWHKIFVDSEPYKYDYWGLPQDTLPNVLNFYFVKLKNGFIKICELNYDRTGRNKCFYNLDGGKQSNVAEWMEYPKE